MTLESAHVLGFLLAVSLLAAGMVLIFFKLNSRDKERSEQGLKRLEEQLSLAQYQIKYRQKGLDRYNMLQYNLEDALCIQPEIDLF
ncbi:hypothetical protein [Leeuwenhoekiella blandensis]|jgi:hypothetical protein|uniref:hypothetical protein n=1 Tax=Leeuwenhoekiella blandensis TaxID=360293 RepID=UPI000C487D8F|nr:hypothetical protein [Leeuwenhoekiella blandensis]MAO43331.1 hypothetical protein [Leeuwenhoekiella sp.]|tara:strand:- start:223 stop:480 length:258 start_codon:yes stop_codon:yes gene_type:complete